MSFVENLTANPDKTSEATSALAGAYRMVFNSPSGRIVLRDLAIVCHAATSTLADEEGVDMQATLVRAAKRDVFLRIAHFLTLDADQLIRLAVGVPINKLME
jgi:hypothetical protein